MGLFSGARKKSDEAFLNELIDYRDGWYDTEAFCDILKKERNRSNRTGLPISYILIDLRKTSPHHPPASEKDFRDFLTRLLRLISENTRDYDVKHLISVRQVGILLIDTPLEGAKAFVEKISHILFQDFQNGKRETCMHLIDSVVISTYPAGQISECDMIQAKPVVVKDLQLGNHRREDPIKNAYRESSAFYMDWQLQTAPGGGHRSQQSAPQLRDKRQAAGNLSTVQTPDRYFRRPGRTGAFLTAFPDHRRRRQAHLPGAGAVQAAAHRAVWTAVHLFQIPLHGRRLRRPDPPALCREIDQGREPHGEPGLR